MSQGDPPSQPDDFDERLQRLRERTRDEKGTAPTDGSGADGSGMGVGLRIAVDLVAGVGVGLGIGYLIDRFFGTRPWGLVVMMFVGFAAGLLNVYRTAQNLDRGKS